MRTGDWAIIANIWLACSAQASNESLRWSAGAVGLFFCVFALVMIMTKRS